MPHSDRKPRVGVLALTLDLYEQLAPGLREGREAWLRAALLPALSEYAEILFAGAVFHADSVAKCLTRYEAEGAEALLVICLTYSPSQVSLGALRRTRLPIVIWNTQELWAVDAQFTPGLMTDNHGVHGTQDLANVLRRSEVPFAFVTSHVRDPDGLTELAAFFRAAAAVSRLRRLRLGLLGYPFPGMGDFACDTTHLCASLGCGWKSLAIEDYIAGAEAAPACEVAAIQDDYRARYAVAGDLSPRDLELTARAEWALRSLLEQHRVQAFSYQFMAFGEDSRTQTVPFVAASRLMADGLGFAGEGDLPGAVNTWLLQQVAGPASFSEMFTIDFAGNGLFLSHMGEANVAMARSDRPVPLVARPKPITRTQGRQLVLVTSFEPGPATLCALALGPRQRWRLIVSRVMIADFGPLAAMPLPHSTIHVRGDVREWLTAYAHFGGPHHHAICPGDATAQLKQLAALLPADYYEV